MRILRGLVVLALLSSAVRSSAAVLTVDIAGGGMFSVIQDAVVAAADGDIILIAAGDYSAGMFPPPIVIDGKGLTLLATPHGASVRCPGVTVRNLTATQQVVVRGIDVGPSPPLSLTLGCVVKDCSGAVWIEDCVILGEPGGLIFSFPTPGHAGVAVTNSTAVSLVRCVVTGGSGHIAPPALGSNGGAGVHATSSSVTVHDSQIHGGAGTFFGTSGGAGVLLDSGRMQLSGADVVGGLGPAIGGDGLHVSPGPATLRYLDCTFQGGNGGTAAGDAVDAPPGAVASWPAMSRTFRLSSPAVALAPLDVELHGLSGDNVFLFWSVLGAHSTIGGTQGWLLLASPPKGPFFLVGLPPSGSLTFSVNAPPLVPSTIQGFTFLMQGYFANGLEVVAGSGSAFVLLGN